MVISSCVSSASKYAGVLSLFLGITACTTSDVASTAQPTKAFENPMLLGEESYWRGDGVDKNGQNWPMSVRLGGKIATVEYPTLGCTGKWYKTVESQSSSAYMEKIVSGNGRCIDGGFAYLSLQKSGNIVFLYSRTASGPKEAVAVLERGMLGDVSRERLVRLTKDEALRDKETDVAFDENIRNVDNPEFERIVAENTAKKVAPKTNQQQMNGDVAAARLLGGLIGMVYGDALNSGSSSVKASSQSYTCKFKCEGQGGMSRSNEFTLKTPYSNLDDAQRYVKNEYEAICKKYPFYSSGGGAVVGFPKCEYYY